MCTGNCEIMNNKLALHNISCQLLDMFTYRTFENCPPMKGIMKMLICSNSEKPYFNKNSIYVLNIIYGVTIVCLIQSIPDPRIYVHDHLSSTLFPRPSCMSWPCFFDHVSLIFCTLRDTWLLTLDRVILLKREQHQ